MTAYGRSLWWRLGILTTGLLLGAASPKAGEIDNPATVAGVPLTVADVLASFSKFQADPSAISSARERMARPLPANSVSPTERIADFLERAAAAAQIGDQQLRLKFARAAGMVEGAGEPSNRLLQEWANAEEYAGNVKEGIRLRELSRLRWPRRQGGFISDNAVLADTYASLGDLDAVRRLLKESEDSYRQMRFSELWNDNEIANIERQRGDVAFREGRYLEAEVFYRKAYEAAGRDLDKNRRRQDMGLNTMSQDVVVSMRDLRGVKLANTLLQLGRITEAEWYARELIRLGFEYSGRSHPSTARSVGLLGRIVLAHGRLIEAEALSRASLMLMEEAGIADPSRSIAAARGQIGDALLAQERWADAIGEFERRITGVSSDPVLLDQVERGGLSYGIALFQARNYVAAESVLKNSHRHLRVIEGESGATAATAMGFLALARGKLGKRSQALKDLAQSYAILESQDRYQDEEASGRFVNRLRFRWLSEAYLELMADEIEALSEVERQPWISTAFAVAGAVRRSSVQKALSASATRAAIRDPALAELARKEQDAGLRSAALSHILSEILGRPPEQRLPKIEGDLRRDMDGLREQRSDLRRQIEMQFPDYSALVSPRLVLLSEIIGVLEDHECLLVIYPSENAAYVWAINSKGQTGFHRANVNRKQLSDLVARLRASVDLAAFELGRELPPYDFDAAYKLYAGLLEPVATVWRGSKSLIASVGAPLSQIPLTLLVTDRVVTQTKSKEATPFAEYRIAPWLIRDVAVSQIPSVSALSALRKLPAANPTRLAFLGYGDPAFSTISANSGASRLSRRVRAVGLGKRRALTIQDLHPVLQGGSGPASVQVRPPEALPYDAIPPLPDTREEILAIASALGANQQSDVFFGREASVQNVKSGMLANRKIIAFATHGLTPGEFPGINEPALAMANPGNGQHGLLTLSDVLTLKLDADWVVLSACNTAAGDGEGSEAVTGLGRGFFYAGARALLVTHWPVESRSAKDLVRGIFERYARPEAMSRSEALRQSMLAMIDTTGDPLPLAHPAFWAPYDLIGDGRRK